MTAVNLLRLLAETATVEDYVVVKMDVEGAERQILLCVQTSPYSALIDKLIIETHGHMMGGRAEGEAMMADVESALDCLRAQGTEVVGWD